MVHRPTHDPLLDPVPEDRRIRRSWWLAGGAFALLALFLVGRMVAGGSRPVDWVPVILVALTGAAAAWNRRVEAAREVRRRGEAESVARLVRGLSRSVSADAIVGAIAGELAAGIGADHVVVVRRRTDPTRLEATLVSTRPGIPDSTTSLPLSDLEDRPEPSIGQGRRRTSRGDDRSAVIPVAREELVALAPSSRPPLLARAATAVGVVAGGSAAGIDDVPPVTTRPTTSPTAAHAAPPPGSSAADPEAARRIAERIADRVRGVYALRHTLSAPLIVDGEAVGALVLSRRSSADWPASSRRLLDEASVEASVALARAYSYRAAQEGASTDGLTRLPNRRYFDEFCGLLARRRRAGDAIGVMMIDIDHFKRLNDRYGHATGDTVLRAVAGAIAGAVREADVPARYGGEEFAVLLRNPSRDVAVEVGERVRAAVGALDLREHGVEGVSVSVGVAVQATPDQPISELIERADQALYRAKEAGRDRVVAA